MKLLSAAATLALTLTASLGGTAAQATERVLFNCFFPPQHYVCKVFLPEMKSRIETATEGRVKVNFAPKSLAAPPDQYDGIVGGVMDGAVQFNGFLGNLVPGIQFSMLPFVGDPSSAIVGPALWQTYQEHFGDKNEYGDVVLVSVFALSGSEIYSVNDTPIATIEDISGRKMWAPAGTVANTVKETGSPVVAGPAVQMLEIVSKGVVDGYIGVPWSSVQAYKLADYTTSASETEAKLFQPTFSFMISRAKWDAFSPEDQAAIHEALGADFAGFMGAFQDKVNADARDAMIAAGIVATPADPSLEAELRRHGQPLVDSWIDRVKATGVDGQAVLAAYQARIDAARAATE